MGLIRGLAISKSASIWGDNLSILTQREAHYVLLYDFVRYVLYSLHEYFHMLYVVLGAMGVSQGGVVAASPIWNNCRGGETALT